VKLSKHVIAAAIALTAPSVSSPASAAPVPAATEANGKVLILVPLTLTKLADLDFGTVIPSAISGTVTIDSKTGARGLTGGALDYPSDVGHRGYFATAGSPNQLIIISVDAPANLISTTNPSDKIPVLALTLDGKTTRRVDPVTRTFFFGVGGVIQINPNQPDGTYESTFDVTVMYP
jgi:spore coat protein U-like protein